MVYHIDQNLTFKTFDTLVAELGELTNERSASQTQRQLATRRAISEMENYPAWSVVYSVTIDETLCLQPLPCCGITQFSYQTQVFPNCQGEGCYHNVPSATIEHGQLRVPRHAYGDGRLTVYGFNEVTDRQETGPGADVIGGEYHVYLKGQPEIPSFGFLRICEENFFYRCKSGYEWGDEAGLTIGDYTIQILSTDEVDSGDGLSASPTFTDLGKYRPRGAHTVLYTQPVDDCGRMQQVQPELLFPGTEVEFPIVYHSSAYANLLLSTAAAHLYMALINSCTSAKDTERFTNMREYYTQEQQRLIAKVPRVKKARVITRNDFKPTDTLQPGWPAFSPRGLPYKRCC